jgi:two-component system, OmpR family, alkaline phosphatase synthesis response regulator PhoP
MGPLQMMHEQRYQDQHLDLDFEHKIAFLDSKPLALTRKEYDLLALLIQNAGEVVNREALLLRIWGYSNQIRTRTLDVHIRRLRRKLGAYSNVYIETIFGVGYRFQPYRPPRLVQRLTPVLTQVASAGRLV